MLRRTFNLGVSHISRAGITWGLGIAAVLVASVDCSSGQATTCRLGSDCASGVCRSDGTCAPADGPVEAGLDGGATDASPLADASPLPGCTANRDGTVTAAEVPLKAGLHATFRTATNVAVSTSGVVGQGGARTWDLTGALAGDHPRAVDTIALAGAWYAPSFPSATYASRLSDSADLLGVFEVGASALSLRGVVSPADGFTKTNVTYTPSATLMQFPMKQGSQWTTSSTVQGTASGVASIYTEQYACEVDAHGTLRTPFGSFEVLRVKTTLTRTVGILPTITRSFAFVAECFGTVGTISSLPNETQVEFTQAAEVSRIAP
jgi:hypothetical protein